MSDYTRLSSLTSGLVVVRLLQVRVQLIASVAGQAHDYFSMAPPTCLHS
jgi:hypothetical protein